MGIVNNRRKLWKNRCNNYNDKWRLLQNTKDAKTMFNNPSCSKYTAPVSEVVDVICAEPMLTVSESATLETYVAIDLFG